MKLQNFIFCNGVILVVYFAILACLFVHNERKWREYQRQSRLTTIYYGK